MSFLYLGYVFCMTKTGQKTRQKDEKPIKRGQGRPRVEVQKLSSTVRFDPELLADLDAWAKRNGGIGRSAAIRFAVSNLVNVRTAEKVS